MLLTLRQAGSVFGAAHWPDLQPELAPPACVGLSIVWASRLCGLLDCEVSWEWEQ